MRVGRKSGLSYAEIGERHGISRQRVARLLGPDGAKHGRPLALRGPIGQLARKVGGRRKLAELLGVTENTIYTWAERTKRVSRIVSIALDRVAEQVRFPIPKTWNTHDTEGASGTRRGPGRC